VADSAHAPTDDGPFVRYVCPVAGRLPLYGHVLQKGQDAGLHGRVF
jgi:hypothetical protein